MRHSFSFLYAHLINFKQKDPAGESHELGNPEGAFMIAPKVLRGLERAFLFLNIYMKGAVS